MNTCDKLFDFINGERKEISDSELIDKYYSAMPDAVANIINEGIYDEENA